jgi:hypothetical protein
VRVIEQSKAGIDEASYLLLVICLLVVVVVGCEGYGSECSMSNI